MFYLGDGHSDGHDVGEWHSVMPFGHAIRSWIESDLDGKPTPLISRWLFRSE